jgi:hypothetical protein
MTWAKVEDTLIQKTVAKRTFNHYSPEQEDLTFWLSRPPEERLAAVEYLRRQHYGSTTRLQRVARVIQRPPR